MIDYQVRDNSELSKVIAQELELNAKGVYESLKLMDEGNTIPFIARYRKDLTNNLDDEALRNVQKKANEEKALDDRRITIFNTLNDLGIEDEILVQDILNAKTLARLEDLYRPYKPKKKTRASEAIRKGLKPLADLIFLRAQKNEIDKAIKEALKNCEELKDENDCLQGAMDIIAQDLSDNASLRDKIKKYLINNSLLCSLSKVEEDSVYRIYYDFKMPFKKLKDYQILAINRGEDQDYLKVDLVYEKEAINLILEKHLNIKNDQSFCDEILKKAMLDGYDRLIYPSVENELRLVLTEQAQEKALKVFGLNLKAALMVPPIKKQTILALDPGYRNGCKYAVVDETGQCLNTGLIFVAKPFEKFAEANKILMSEINKYGINMCVIGNGTACRETESFFSNFLKENNLKIPYLLVDESGASVYSATDLAAKELPDVPLNNRSAVSLARRVQDPLAELVKIDPKSIGVGQYQHDMNQKALKQELSGVVESCVNQVGVNLNTASAQLLSYVSGLSSAIATNIVNYRNENGSFTSRKQLSKVSKLGPKTFEQCAGFLRVDNSKEPLDNTAIHPESYEIARKFIKDFNLTLNKDTNLKEAEIEKYAKDNNIGFQTLLDINEAITKPNRDIRDNFPAPVLISSIKTIEDLKVGEVLQGVIRNVTAFGAFIDLGLHQDGLCHISELSKSFVKDPLDVVNIGQQVKVKVIDVDIEKKRIQLSIKQA